MSLIQLKISNFRNLIAAELQPLSKGFNYIIGKNGSGKTSLLESIYYLSLGRSFRSSFTQRIMNVHAHQLSIFANVKSDKPLLDAIGIEKSLNAGLKIRINGRDALSVAELASLLPVQLIDSHCHQLLDAGPAVRRKFLDWGVFYKNPEFLRTWRQFERVLKQRNAALRGFLSKNELSSWTNELIVQANLMNEMRYQYVAQLIPCLESIIVELLEVDNLKINYSSGWDSAQDYASVLRCALESDFQLGYTQYGPQKADLKMSIGGVPAKDILSRGQQKLFVCAMIIAQGMLLHKGANRQPIYLIDDLPSELDITSRSKLLALLSKQNAQFFITAVDRESLSLAIAANFVKVFHVEHGNVSDVS